MFFFSGIVRPATAMMDMQMEHYMKPYYSLKLGGYKDQHMISTYLHSTPISDIFIEIFLLPWRYDVTKIWYMVIKIKLRFLSYQFSDIISWW